jgi:hypothetical protein
MCGLWYKQLYLVAAAAEDGQVHTFAVTQNDNEHNECHECFLIFLCTVLQTRQGRIITFLTYESGRTN